MKYSDEDKLKMFKNELDDIKSDAMREFAKSLILNADDYFFTTPASTTGKYHPSLSLGDGGLIRHTRLVEWYVKNIATAMMIDDNHTDCLIVSAIVHDMKKLGDGSTKYTVKDHPKQAAEFMERVWNETKSKDVISKEELEKMKAMVESHMGQWGKADNLPVPSSKMELILHTADYLASRKEIAEFTFRQIEEIKKTDEPASEYLITFGKHKNKTIGGLYLENPEIAIDYFEWVAKNEDFKFVEAKEKMIQFLNENKAKNA